MPVKFINQYCMLSKAACFFLSTFLLLIYSCSNNSVKPAKKVFIKLNAAESGIGFNNIITENDSVNLISNEYTYMGGGVGIIDISNVSSCNRLTIHHTQINIIHCP